jgi:hypothetical protein
MLEVCRFKIEGTGYNTESLVEEAVRIKESWEKDTIRPVDKLWVVFDKDSFEPLAFNNAVKACDALPATEAAWSNEAFELWYLLHFNYHDSAMSRRLYRKKIEESFKTAGLADYAYRKNSRDMFKLLSTYGDVQKAVRFAKRLHENHANRQDHAALNPCTTVYKLVEELLELEKEFKKGAKQPE